jgi:hypothetical protein
VEDGSRWCGQVKSELKAFGVWIGRLEFSFWRSIPGAVDWNSVLGVFSLEQ